VRKQHLIEHEVVTLIAQRVFAIALGYELHREGGTTTLRFLEIFKSSYFADVSINQWMALTPRSWWKCP
jgi:hypothetical protein